ncbi:MAG TPA: cyclic nucleotide-binding domain-containing protein [Candidatus Limnocylindrales bacterium]|nr:cyclic nucleotide-binding domain-containing protein [Candidatus Limnocylindrales bacterium]
MDAAVTARLLRALGIRPGEGALVLRVAALFAVLEAAAGLGEVGAETQLVSHLGSTALSGTLPYLFIALGVVGLLVSLGYAVTLARVPRHRLFLTIVVGIAGLLVLQRLALAAGLDVVVPGMWLTVLTASAIDRTIAWTVAGSTFDARQAKRVFPLLTGAAIVGSFTGTLSAGPVAGLAGVPNLFAIQAVLLLVAGAMLVRLPRTRARATRTLGHQSVVDDLRVGFDTVRRSPLMRLVAIVYVLLSVLMFSVSYPFYIAAARDVPEAQLATTLGLLSTAVTATSFIVSLAFANRIYARFGVSAGALALPVVYLLGFGGWLLRFSFTTAAAFRFSQQVTQRGLSNAAWSAFYNVVPADRRAQVLAFNDGVPGQVGTVLSGVLLLAVASLSGLEPVFWLGLVTAAAGTVVVLGIRRRYAASLLDALRSGLAEQVLEGGPGLPAALERPDFRDAVVAALGASDPGTRQMAVDLLGRVPALRPEERTRLDDLVDDPSPGVRGAVAVALARTGADDRASQLIADLLSASDDASRLAGLAAARAVPDRVSTESLRPLAMAESAPVRAACLLAAAAHPDGAEVTAIGDLISALDDEDGQVRNAAARVLSARDGAEDALLDVLRSGAPRAQEAALTALAGHAATARDGLLDRARDRIERAEALHVSRATLDGSLAAPPLQAFLAQVVDRRIRRAEDQAIAALVTVGAPAAGGLLRRSLRSDDPDARAQAIEALDSLGDRRLGRALTACLEASTADGRGDPSTALARLSQDDDPWLRRLSRRILEVDRTPPTAEETMPGQDAARSELDTMLLLRRVPLFAGLDPEDLQRIALVTGEREYDAGDALMTEGDVGDELVILTEGTVRVVHRDADGSERFIRTYTAGDHIGELAVLRDRPRAATVVAEDGGARGLVLGGEGLKAILRERPDAAMAMLATLAERITHQ